MAKKIKTKPYSEWEPVIEPEEVFSKTRRIGGVSYHKEGLFWLESLPEEKSRIALVKEINKGKQEVITPSDFYIRTRVHEYGGASKILVDNGYYFTNFKDQRLYFQSFNQNEKPKAITPEENADGSIGKYGAFALTPDKKKLLFVYEKEYSDKENQNFIALLKVQNNDDKVREPDILLEGNDFYDSPTVSPDGKYIAWITWNHPNMPWDGTTLCKAKLNGSTIEYDSIEEIAGGKKTSVSQPVFDSQGKLYFIMDEAGYDNDNPKNWMNIYCYDGKKVKPITQEFKEFGSPCWVVGTKTYKILPDDTIIGIYQRKGRSYLYHIDPKTPKIEKRVKTIETPFTEIISITIINQKEILMTVSSPTDPLQLIKFDLSKKEVLKTIRKSYESKLNEKDISNPELIEYPTADGKKAYAHFYPPKNSNYKAPKEEKNPVITKIHGGPTGRTTTRFNLSNIYWTSKGFAIVDVDYRGSTSYGRNYRDQLKKEWGEIDIQDIHDVIKYLQDQGRIGDKAFITGGSAGGYAVQRAMTKFPDLFSGGASYFGIGNLETLARTTHKFESRYLDSLIGASLDEDKELYKQRSPIFHLEKLKAPMILFQGAEDKVVPPELSREVAEQLEKRGIYHEYVEYEKETHGFRQKENLIDSLEKEAAFYHKIIKDKI
jgi:dipeptidyl aminopeptidase/acylaminoacyl peptidase